MKSNRTVPRTCRNRGAQALITLMIALGMCGGVAGGCSKPDVSDLLTPRSSPPPPPTPGPFGVWSGSGQSMVVRRDSSVLWQADVYMCALYYRTKVGGRFHAIGDSLPISGSADLTCDVREGTASILAQFDPGITQITGTLHVSRLACCGDFYPTEYTAPVALVKTADLSP